jgi:uncharacterized membrane protein
MQRSVGRSRIISFVPACGILGVTKMAEALVQAGPTVLAAFLTALVEAVEALTVVLAVASVRGWRAAGAGALCGLALLALIVATLGPLLNQIPMHLLQLMMGTLLLLFGSRWLRKAMLRSAGVIPLHDEAAIFGTEVAALRDQERGQEAALDWLGGAASFEAVLVEGLEVAFVVLALSAGRGHLAAASIGALVACLLVAAIGLVLHRPLARVPENTLKFAVGIILSSFGLYWTGERLGVPWPGGALAIIGFAILLAAVASGVAAVRGLSR